MSRYYTESFRLITLLSATSSSSLVREFMKALFLGAGASYELGLPLVWELTAEIKNWLTPEKIDWLNEQWRNQGGGRSDKAISLMKELLSVDSLHYEAILGSIEVEINRERNGHEYQELYGLYSWLLQMIYHMLLARQVKNESFILDSTRDFYAIKKLCEQNKPLWVFSLNHDINAEIIAAAYDIPVKSGFTGETSLPERDEQGNLIGRLGFESLSREDINNNNYDFFANGEYGINLIKLHGSLDIFAQGDELNYLKVKPDEYSVQGYISSLHRANNNLRYYPFAACTNEIAYADDGGEMQFLRRTLLSGAHKFSGKMSQLAPPEFLKLFESYINFADELVCIGYGFGDSHIDKVIRNWLSFSRERSLKVINPGVKSVSDISNAYLHLVRQITFNQSGFIDFMLSLDSSNDSLQRKALRILKLGNRNKMKDLILNGT